MTYSTWLRSLKLSLWIGAIYDVAFALVLFVAPGFAAQTMKVPMPEQPFFLWMIGLFLMILAAFYLLAAYDPISYSGNVMVAIFGRFGGFLVLAYAAQSQPILAGLLVPALVDLFFSVWHAVSWWPIKPAKS
jgi:hypothetical protein